MASPDASDYSLCTTGSAPGEGGREGGRKRGREGERERGREGEREGGREEERKRGREGGRKVWVNLTSDGRKESTICTVCVCMTFLSSLAAYSSATQKIQSVSVYLLKMLSL